MGAGKHGSAEWTISVDDAQGGSLRAITPYVMTVSGIKITSIMQLITAFGDAFEKSSATGVQKADPITFGGEFDDTAVVGPHVVFKSVDVTIYDGTTATSRTLSIVVGNSRTFAGEVLLVSYEVLGKNGNLTEYQAVVQPTGSFSWT